VTLTEDEMQCIHQWSITLFGGDAGVRDPGGVEAVLARPLITAFGEVVYATPFARAAAVLEATVRRHPYADGNKRTGLAAGLFILNQAGFSYVGSNEGSVALVLGLISHAVALDAASEFLEEHARVAETLELDPFLAKLDREYEAAFAELAR
jgi:death-on-curing protein